MFLIPERILTNLICHECKKYLSVAPVKVYPNRRILCGRCSKDNDGGVELLYGNIVQKGLFKCINKYDGYNQVLLYSEVLSHEAHCKSELYRCPNCLLVPEMPAFLLIEHFKQLHKESILENSIILINVNRCNVDKKYLYIKEDFLFIICVTLYSKHIVLNTFHIGNVKLSREITQRFILSSSDHSLERCVTGKRPCCTFENNNFDDGFNVDFIIKECTLNVEIDIDTIKAYKLLLLPISSASPVVETEQYDTDSIGTSDNKFYLGDDFKKMWSSEYTIPFSGNCLVNKINQILKCCCFCQNKFHFFSESRSIFKCTDCSSDFDKFICSRCYFFGINKCDNGNYYKFVPEETTVFQSVEYFCKWNCGEKFLGWNLRGHEYTCDIQKQHMCPIKNCEWMEKLSNLPKHIKTHKRIGFYGTNLIHFNSATKRTLNFYDELVVSVLDYFVNIKWKQVNAEFLFSLYIKRCKNKIPVAVVKVNKGINIYTDLFVLDVHRSPSLLIILRDV